MQAFVTLSMLTPRLVVGEDYGQKHENRHSLRGALPSVLRLFGLRWSKVRPTREQAPGWLNECKWMSCVSFSSSCAVWCGARMDPDWGASHDTCRLILTLFYFIFLYYTLLHITSRHAMVHHLLCSDLLYTNSTPLFFTGLLFLFFFLIFPCFSSFLFSFLS